jgi:hypothetical protein
MEKHQFEELTAGLSIIITLLAYKLEVDWLFYIFFGKACIDTFGAIRESYRKHK